jgi:imidazolonepropionase-like amidohydrolase
MGLVALLRERLVAARVLLDKGEDGSDKDLPRAPERFRIEPYVGLLVRRYPARVRVATAHDAWTALRLADEFGFDLILEELTEGHRAGLPEELARRGIACVLGPMLKAAKTPETADRTFHTAVALAEAGVTIAFCSGHPSRNIRFLASEAALAVRAGLDEDSALRGLTSNAAAVLGLDSQIGSLEPGKQADIAIFDGHPLLPVSRVTHTIIAGGLIHRGEPPRPSRSGAQADRDRQRGTGAYQC